MTAGNGALLYIAYEQSSARALAATNAITDQSNNPLTYAEVGTGEENGSNYAGYHVVWVPNVPSGVTGFKATLASASSAGIGMVAVEIAGATNGTTFALYEQAEAVAGSGSDNVATVSGSPSSQPGILVAASLCSSDYTAPSAGTGFTLIGTPSFNLGFGLLHLAIESSAYTTTASQKATFTGTSGKSYETTAVWLAEQPAAAVLSSPAVQSETDVTVTASVSTTSGVGTIYVAVTNTNVAPTQNSDGTLSGANVVATASQAAAAGTNTIQVSGLTASTGYWVWFSQYNGAKSNVPASVSFTTTAPAPSVTSVSSATPANGSSLTLTGTNFGAAQGTVKLGGITQVVTAWSNTSITITVDRGTNAYGVLLGLVVTSAASLTGATYNGVTGLTPQSGWSYVNLGTLNANAAYRITALSDLASGDQLAYDNKGGLVTVNTDGTFVTDSSVTSFAVEAWTSGSGWGSQALQNLSAIVKKHVLLLGVF
jgi:hypothetical protein